MPDDDVPRPPRAHSLAAVAHLEATADARAEAARARIVAILDHHGIDAPRATAMLGAVLGAARVTLNFHPDRLDAKGRTVASGLLRDGRYVSQWVTRTTNGSPTAFAGGARATWESRLFGGAYDRLTGTPEAASDERPKYGALDVMRHSDGGSPRFGSCFFVLRPEAAARCTFTWGDSHLGPEDVGTARSFSPIVAAWLETVVRDGAALGVAADVPALLARDFADPAIPDAPGRTLDDYIEAQVHGPIELPRDVEELVVDPSFASTETGATLSALGARYGIPIRHHAGFVLAADEVPDDFRGPRMRPLAERIAGRAPLDAALLGQAARALHLTPDAFADWAAPTETWQHLKQLWHVLVRFGRAAAR